MAVEFYKSKGVGFWCDFEAKATLDDLAKHVNEDAAVEWDRFCIENDIPLEDSIRFVCVAGEWRAFTGEPQKRVGNKDGFIAQWHPDTKLVGGLYVPTGTWKLERTKVKKEVEFDEEESKRGLEELRGRVKERSDTDAIECTWRSWPTFMGGEK